MKKMLSVTAAIVGLSASAACADGMHSDVPIAAPTCASFGGGYLGVNGGWAFHD